MKTQKDNQLPRHIGIIMDGNGRWAKDRGKKRTYGHQKGGKVVEKIVKYAFKRGIKIISLYAFSSENWKRPQEEIDGIFKILKNFLNNAMKNVTDQNIKFDTMGDISVLPLDLFNDIQLLKEKTKNNTGGTINIGINYGSTSEIVAAVNVLVDKGIKITEQTFSSYLYTKDLLPLDLIIRTGGQKRLSNFMLYQASYSELYFTDVLWPDFGTKDLDVALLEYGNRIRNFGGIKNA